MTLRLLSLIITTHILFTLAFAQDKGVKTDAISRLPSSDKRWALIVGLNNYGLKGAVNDAKALKKTLVKYAGFAESQVVLLTSDDPANPPDRKTILLELARITRSVPEGGMFLFAFSGHGKTIGDNAYLIPSDGILSDDDDLLGQLSINVTDVKKAVEKSKIKQVMMLIDVCRDRVERGDRGKVSEALTPSLTRGFSFEDTNKTVEAFVTLYATRLGEFAYEFFDKETGQWRGYFSRAVEEGLSGKAANEKGEITLAGLVRYLEETVPQRSYRNEGKRQTPLKTTNNGFKENDLVLAALEHAGAPVFENTILQGELTFNYEVNKTLSIGTGDYQVTTSWSKCTDTCVYTYSDHNAGMANSRLKSFDAVRDATAFDMSARFRIISLNEVAVFKNKSNYYAMVQVLKVSEKENLLSIRYKILPSRLESTWVNKNFSTAMSGTVSMDLSNTNHTFTIGDKDFAFDTHWSGCSFDCIYLVGFPYNTRNPVNIAEVALVNDSAPIKTPGDAARYPKAENKVVRLDRGQRAIMKNLKGKYVVITLIDIKTMGSISVDPESKKTKVSDIDQIVFTYEILPG